MILAVGLVLEGIAAIVASAAHKENAEESKATARDIFMQLRESRIEITKEQLKSMRESLRWSQADAARMLLTPYRTYQGWEAGESRIPGVVKVAMGLLIERDEKTMARIMADVVERIDKQFPNGIPSAPIEDEDEE